MRELALHILDLARNSIEAGATRLHLTVTEDPETDRLEITVADNGKGMEEATRAQVTSAFFTTRDSRRWGLGLPLFEAACERCGGAVEISSQPGEGTVVRGELRLGHLDRAPLGDMGAVIQALALESGQMALRYEHRVGEQSFVLDTGELQRELGEAPLSDPQVLVWLAEHVRKGLQEIGIQA